MNLFLNDILKLTKEEIKNSKIEFNMRAGRSGESYLDRWLSYTDSEKENGLCVDCSYWGWYGKRRNFYPGQVVFSFIRMNNYDEWLLISAGRVVEIPENNRAKVEIINKYSSLFGRLILKCKKGNTFARYVFDLKKYLDSCAVKEILPCLYSGEKFEGYDKVHLSFNKLSDIFNGKIMPTYFEALSKIKGIYCLTDTHNGKLYIGSATGEEGIKQRWGNYFSTKDGGNKKLIELHKQEGDEYFEKYFTFTLLEYFNLSYDDQKIIDREQYWKDCLDTRKHGYNDN